MPKNTTFTQISYLCSDIFFFSLFYSFISQKKSNNNLTTYTIAGKKSIYWFPQETHRIFFFFSSSSRFFFLRTFLYFLFILQYKMNVCTTWWLYECVFVYYIAIDRQRYEAESRIELFNILRICSNIMEYSTPYNLIKGYFEQDTTQM
jgi:hypothetical protein